MILNAFILCGLVPMACSYFLPFPTRKALSPWLYWLWMPIVVLTSWGQEVCTECCFYIANYFGFWMCAPKNPSLWGHACLNFLNFKTCKNILGIFSKYIAIGTQLYETYYVFFILCYFHYKFFLLFILN